MKRKPAKSTAYDKLPKSYRKLISDLEDRARHFAGSGTTKDLAEKGNAVAKARNRLALAFKRLLDLQEPAEARVILNLHGGIVQDACYDGKHPIDVIVVDWDVAGGEADQLLINDQWCWVYTAQVAAYSLQTLTDVAAAADAYLEKSMQKFAHEVLPDPR